MRLKDKVAIVTGGGNGIGRAISIGIAKEGARAVIADLSIRDAEDVENEINSKGNISKAIKVDVSKVDDVENVVRWTIENFGKVDILVNNAGILPRTLIRDMDEDEWDRVINVNLKGVFLCSKAVARHMVERREGKIVSMTSGRGVGGQAKGSHYSASKAGIIAFTKSLALELAQYNINVNAVAPGITDTSMWRGGTREEGQKLKREISPLMGGVSMPEDIVETIIFLTTEASKHITGQVFFLKPPY